MALLWNTSPRSKRYAVRRDTLEVQTNCSNIPGIALPARLVQLKPASGGSWLFAKTFVDADFTAAGKLHIPPYSTKEEKSTRDNTYVRLSSLP